jgi:hypothetical protein
VSVEAERRLIVVAAQLSSRAPEQWADFVAAFHAYTDDRKDDVVQANPDSLVNSQGRAQACVHLRKLFSECREQADRITTRQSKPSQPR